MKTDSIIFDLDGTLWDSTETVIKSWNKVLKDNKEIRDPITIEVLKGMMGMRVYDIGNKLFPYLEKAEQAKVMDTCCEEERKLILLEGGKLFLELENVLETLSRSYPLFIVSNCQSGYIEAFLQYHNLGKYFKDIECSGNTGLVKGENIKMLMVRNGLKSSVYVGDAQVDCDAAKLANIPFVFASFGFGKVTSYDYTIEKITDIIRLLVE